MLQRSTTPPPAGRTAGAMRAEQEKKELSLLWERLTQRGKEVDALEKQLAEREADISQLRHEVDSLSARLRKEQERSQQFEARGRRLHRELGAAIGLSLSPSPSRGKVGCSHAPPLRRAQTPPPTRSGGSTRSRSPCFGLGLKAQLMLGDSVLDRGTSKLGADKAEDESGKGAEAQDAPAALTGTVRSEEHHCKIVAAAAVASEDVSVLATPGVATVVPEDTPEVAEQAQQCQADIANAMAQAESRIVALQQQLLERESELAGSKHHLQQHESELARLRQASTLQATRLAGVRSRSVAMRRRALRASAQLLTTRRRRARELGQIQTERAELMAWRDELMLWWEAKSMEYAEEQELENAKAVAAAYPSSSNVRVAAIEASDMTEQPTMQGAASTASTAQQFFIGDSDEEDEVAEVVDADVVAADAEAEFDLTYGTCPASDLAPTVKLDPCLLPNCSRDSRRIARGGHAPSRIGSLLKNLKPKKSRKL